MFTCKKIRLVSLQFKIVKLLFCKSSALFKTTMIRKMYCITRQCLKMFRVTYDEASVVYWKFQEVVTCVGTRCGGGVGGGGGHYVLVLSV